MHQLPPGLGLWWLIPLWLVMAAIAAAALAWGRARAWRRDGAVMVLCMIGCAMVAFVPPAYYAGISTTRHMVGMNLATALAFVVAAGLAVSMIRQLLTRPARRAVLRRRARDRAGGARSVRERDDDVGGLDHRDHVTCPRPARVRLTASTVMEATSRVPLASRATLAVASP